MFIGINTLFLGLKSIYLILNEICIILRLVEPVGGTNISTSEATDVAIMINSAI